MITPKTNWTSDDYYNFEDLNRVESNTQFVAGYLQSIDYPVQLEEVVNNRTMIDIDFLSSINRVERNIESIRSSMNIIPPGYGAMKIWPQKTGFSHQDAIRYEKNIELLYLWATRIYESYKYCGTFACGEEVI